MTKLTKASIFCGAALAVILGWLATSVRAHDFDVRDYLPDGTLFEISDIGLKLNWDTSTQTLQVVSAGLVLETETSLDNVGRLVFAVSPGERSISSISSIDGTVDLLPNGEFHLAVDQIWDDGMIDAITARSNGVNTIATGHCDCSDGVTLTCLNNHCNASLPCPPAPNKDICVWSGPVVP